MDHPEDHVPANPNYNPNNYHHFNYDEGMGDFELSDYLMLDDGVGDDHSSSSPSMVSSSPSEQGAGNYCLSAGNNDATSSGDIASTNNKRKIGVKKIKTEVVYRVAFRTKSELEVMDDGFKWRKYGKKSVKNSPNPRNYYKCSIEGCNVKKRVERDREDIRFVITTYEGVHNHASSDVAYCNQMPTTASNGHTVQDSSHYTPFTV